MQENKMAELSQRAGVSLASGQIEEARNLYTQLSELDANNEETWLILAAIHGESGDLSKALQCADQAISIDPDYVEAHLARGHLLQRLDRFEDAIESALKAVEKDDEYGKAWLFLGGLAGRLERTDAVEWAERAVRLLPGSSEALINLGNAHYQQGLFEEAEAAFRNADRIAPGVFASDLGVAKAVAAQQRYTEAVGLLETAVTREPDDVETLDNLGVCYIKLGRQEEAVAIFDRIIDAQPDYAPAYLRVARLFADEGSVREAIEYLTSARANVTDPLAVLGELAKVYHDHAMPQEAIQCCEDVLALDPGNFEARFFRAVSKSAYTKYEEAMPELDELVVESPDDPRIVMARAAILERMGDYEAARTLVLPYLDADPGWAVDVFARLCRHFGDCDRAIGLVEDTLATEGLDVEYRRALLLTQGKLLDNRSDYEAAFASIREANDLMPYRYDHQVFVGTVDRLMAPEVTDLVAGMPLADIGTHGVQPVFIVGMNRSGTSLVEQIIASHPCAWGGGERHEIASFASLLGAWTGSELGYPECLTQVPPEMFTNLVEGYTKFTELLPVDVSVLTDKMPGNFLHLVLIRLLFPGARIIHCVRDPRDTCLSCYFQQFVGYHNYAYDLKNLGDYHREYQRLMTHYRDVVGLPMLEVSYEELVADTERLSREIIDYCGLDWDDRCLRYYESDRVVRTASYDQVRQPIYTSSVGRWRHYEKHLAPLLEALGIASE